MTTKIITVDISEARIGDHFTGTLDRNGATVTVTGKVQSGEFDRGQLWVVSSLPYLHAASWYDVSVTREVPTPPTKTNLPVGTIVQGTEYGYLLFRREPGGGWRSVDSRSTMIMPDADMAGYLSEFGEFPNYYKVIYTPGEK